MRVYDVAGRVDKEKGEFILGSKDTGSHACYMIYGKLGPGEEGRVIRPGKGHEEIIFAVTGDLEVSGAMEGVLREGSAIHIAGDKVCRLKNLTVKEALYIASGGHSEGGH